MKAEISKTYRFEAAHFLPNVPKGHPCGNMHGHSWVVTITVEGDIDQHTGWVMDYGDISKIVRPIVDDVLDHQCLNHIPGLENPTSENLAAWLVDEFRSQIPGLVSIAINETCTSECKVFA